MNLEVGMAQVHSRTDFHSLTSADYRRYPPSFRLRELEAVLAAIEEGQLLADVPVAAGAAIRHQAAVSLLSILQREMQTLIDDLEEANGF
jgi:hypothetical protein